ncbi:hypothetical protein LEP1GSC088_0425 [Leptospira interrogans str. L1207]|nr:hypothetical protein LEP1GSC088_0425 [Leptospira interrogans str. L1207]
MYKIRKRIFLNRIRVLSDGSAISFTLEGIVSAYTQLETPNTTKANLKKILSIGLMLKFVFEIY